MKSTNILLFSAIWALGHLVIALLFIHLLFQLLSSFWETFWSFSFIHFCWLEMARTYKRRNF
jgi:hypothetical protein